MQRIGTRRRKGKKDISKKIQYTNHFGFSPFRRFFFCRSFHIFYMFVYCSDAWTLYETCKRRRAKEKWTKWLGGKGAKWMRAIARRRWKRNESITYTHVFSSFFFGFLLVVAHHCACSKLQNSTLCFLLFLRSFTFFLFHLTFFSSSLLLFSIVR